MARLDADLVPLNRGQRLIAWWRRSANRRRNARQSIVKAAPAVWWFAISVAGAILIAFGAYQIYAPSGYIVGGLLAWLLVWSNEQDKGRQGS